MPLLETRRLSHRFPDGTLALDDVSLAFPQGQLCVVAGANGSGKTVFARHLNALLRPTSGEVLLDGRPVGKDVSALRQAVGLIFQDSESQFVGQTVEEDVSFGPENLALDAREVRRRVENALSAAGLARLSQANPHALSGGQKRRVAVAGVLAMRPSVVVFDEPFSGLDYSGVRQVLRQVARLKREGVTVIVVTHQLDKVLAHADRLVLFAEGRVAADGEPEDVARLLEGHGVRNPLRDGVPLRRLTWLSDGKDG